MKKKRRPSIIDKYVPQDIKRLQDGRITRLEALAGIGIITMMMLGLWKLFELVGGLL